MARRLPRSSGKRHQIVGTGFDDISFDNRAGNDAGAAEILRDVRVKKVIDAQGITEFSLWDGTDGIFYKQGETAACLMRTESELVLIQFSGETPMEWREVTRLGPG